MLTKKKSHNPPLLTQPSLRRIITSLRWVNGSNASPLQLLAFSPTIFSLQPYVRVHLTDFKLKFHILLWREALSGAQPEDEIQKKIMGKLSPQLLLFISRLGSRNETLESIAPLPHIGRHSHILEPLAFGSKGSGGYVGMALSLDFECY